MTRTLFLCALSLILFTISFRYSSSIIFIVFLLCLFILFKHNIKCYFFVVIVILFEITIDFRNIFEPYPLLNIQNFVLNGKEDGVQEYLKLILFNDKNSEIYKLSVDLSISYLIIISGLHINLLHSFFSRVISYFLNEKIASVISLLILFAYIVILGFPVSSLKSLCMLFLGVLKIKFNKFDKFFITVIVIYILFPYSIFSFSYIYSFLLTFIILSISAYLPKSKVLSSLIVCSISFLITIPINIYISNKINLFSIVYSFIFTYPFMLIVILSFVILIFPFLSSLYLFLVNITKRFMIIGCEYSLYLHSFDFSVYDYCIYYLVLFGLIILINKKNRFFFKYLFLIFLILVSVVSNVKNDSLYEVIFVNVYQGDCIIFKSKYGKEIYMVDTGGSRNYDIASNVIIPLCELMGVDCIRTLIITHSDYDHCGALDSLINLIEIKNILYSVESIDIFGYEFINLNEGIYDNENDNSIVLYGEFYYMKILLMGDVSSIVEEDIVNDYPSLEVDIIKLAHHGSKYSTSDLLLDSYKPKIAILSYGYNHYGHPSSIVIDKLIKRNINIYSTFDDGTLIFFNKYKKEIYLRRLK